MAFKSDLNSDASLTDLENGTEAPYQMSPSSPIPIVAEAQPQRSEFTLPACLTLFGASAVMFCSVGFINAFGVFEEYYQTTFLSHKSASDISWIGSFELFVMFGGTLPIGYLSDKHGPRILLLIGSVITLFSLFMTSLCTQYYQIFLAQGLALGIGISLVILPAFTTVPHYFVANRGLALGLTVSGSSLGGVIWPITLRNLFEEVGFSWGVRISAFIMLPLLGLACLTIKLPDTQQSKGSPKPKPDMSIVKHPILLLLAAGMFMVYLGLFSPFFYITSWTISLGLDANMGFYMVSIINAASLFGRVLPGIWADRIGAFNIITLSAAFSGLVCMCWTTATSMVGIVFLSLAYGFASGAVIGLQGVCAAQVVKPQQYGVAMGFVMSILSIAGLFGSPINGQLLGRWGYLGLSLFSGLAMLIGMLVLMIARFKLSSKLLSKA